MANRNDNRGFEDRGPGRHGRDDTRGWSGYRGRPDERRAFEDRDAQFDADRRRDRGRFDRDQPDYSGQEYGVEAGGRRSQSSDGDYPRQDPETWRDSPASSYGELRRGGPNAGVERFGQPADYAYRPGDHEFEPDYVAWRDEQMRGHDRDYSEWRRAQHRQYDDDYRRFREHRRSSFGQTFSDWRSRQSTVGGVPDTGVAPGVSYAGERSTHSGGYTGGYAPSASSPRASGKLDPSLSMSDDPALSQTGDGARGAAGAGGGKDGDGGPEFGKAPSPVQSAADGGRTDKETRKDERS